MSAASDQHNHKDHIVYISDNEEVELHRPTFDSLSRTSRYFGPQKDVDFGRLDSDSGVCCTSSKATTSSLSDSEEENSSRGVFDYTPKTSSYDNKKKFEVATNCELARKHKEAYDFAVEVGDTDGDVFESSVVSSRPVLPFLKARKDSPVCEGTEMKTFRYIKSEYPNDLTYDEVHELEDDTDNDDGVKHVSLHERLYRDGPRFASMEHEYDVDYIRDFYDGRSSVSNHHTKLNFSSNNFRSRRSNYSPTEVDSALRFPIGPKEPVCLRAMNSENGKLLASQPAVSNLPSADPVSSSSRKKRRKKKTSTSKDGSASDGKDSGPEQSCDVNGNPLEANKSVQDYRSLSLKPHQSRYSARYPQNIQQIGNPSEEQEINGMQVSELEDLSPAEHERLLKQQHRRAKRAKQMNMVTAGTIPGNCGDASIDQLLNFIENSNGAGKRKKKDSSQLQNNNSHVTVPVDAKTSSNNKKTKDKKQRHNSTTSNKDDKESSENSSEKGDGQGSSKGSENGDDRTSKDFSAFVVSKDPKVEEKGNSSDANNSSQIDKKMDKKPVSEKMSPEEFKFTDVGSVPKVEAEFTVVGKKKKRMNNSNNNSSGREVSSSVVRNHILGGVNHHISVTKGETSRAAYRSKPMRSVTPPPVPSSRVMVAQSNDQHSFSPSHFPELSGFHRDGRRNSTGNVPSELPLQDDSDMESVKSYPSECTKISSPPADFHQHLSYANIAAKATTKPPSGENTCTADTSDDIAPSLPTERRHSFGALIESTGICGNNDNPEINISGKNFACRSQELPKTSEHDEGKTCIKISKTSNVLLKPSAETINDGSLDGFEGDPSNVCDNIKHVDIVKTSLIHVNDLAEPCCHSNIEDKTLNELKPEKESETHGEADKHSNTQDQSSLGSEICISQPLEKPVTQVTVAQQTHGHNQPIKPAVAAARTNPPSKKTKTKSSVIFLDKRVRDLPKNLDIKFGFDSEEELKNFEKNINVPVATNVVLPHVNGFVLPSMAEMTIELLPSVESSQESPVPRLSDNDSHSHKSAVAPPIIPVDPGATFNIRDTIIFLKKDWDEIMTLKNSYPEKVTIYSS